jgi:hypothetical protein
MDRKLFSIMLVLFLSIAGMGLAQGRGQGHGPSGPPAGIATQHVEDGGGDHGQENHGQANKPSESHNTTANNDVVTRLNHNTALASKLQGLLPAGTDLDMAAMGFKNLGQFVAAVHVSKNLNIPFDQLKTAMVTNHKSLGDAIHELKPELNTTTVKTEAKKAEDEAKDDTKKTS